MCVRECVSASDACASVRTPRSAAPRLIRPVLDATTPRGASATRAEGTQIRYHGELNSRAREANLIAFREATSGVLVCTDLAARGLDVPDVGHVVMFDFPRNPVDYLHRAGRTARPSEGCRMRRRGSGEGLEGLASLEAHESRVDLKHGGERLALTYSTSRQNG